MINQKTGLLPEHIKPTKYIVDLEPDLEKFTFHGKQIIELEFRKPSNSIVLNSIELTIEPAKITTSSGNIYTSLEPKLDLKGETATFEFAEEIPAGSAQLELKFTGFLNDRLRGFYRSKYTDQEGKERYMASTQFEATDARRAIPCWDEPTYKSIFEVTLIVPPDLMAVSNMPVAAEELLPNGRKSVRFVPSPLMSTYLLAFVVGDLSSIEQRAENGTLVRIWAIRGKEEQGRFALETSVRLLSYFNDYFGIPYPLEKLDHFAIPDFAAGAMENWGAITYREPALLVDPEHSSASTHQLVVAIIAHEMAHMWFGDLVTMAWWDDLWLNESFASWMGDKATDTLFPEWNVWTQFLVNDTSRALNLDALQNSHPIEQEVRNPAEIGQLFDAISYSKGASVIRMLEQFLGASTFQKGIGIYMNRHRYGNARTEDLWDSLAEASDQPVAEMMNTWTKQTGFPLLDVEIRQEGRMIEVNSVQRRFLYTHLLEDQELDPTIWHIPLTARSSDPTSTTVQLVKESQKTVKFNLPSKSVGRTWIKINPGHTGFYRTRYTAPEMKQLLPAITNLELPPADRLGIQSDAFALCRAGYIQAAEYLKIVEAYVNETDESVWAELSLSLSVLDNLLADGPAYERFQGLGRRLYRPIVRKIGWDKRSEEGHTDALLRSIVLGQLGSFGDSNILQQASLRFAQYANDPTTIHPDLRRVIFSLAAQNGEKATHDQMWKLHEESLMQEEQMRILGGLTQFKQSELLQETLERSISDQVRTHETISVVSRIASNRHGRDLSWEFIKENWQEFDRRYGEGGFGLMQLVSAVGGFTSEERLNDVETFFSETSVPSAERTIRQSLERIRLNIAWIDRNRQSLETWSGSG